MKQILLIAAAIGLFGIAFSSPVFAEEPSGTKAPPKTTGDEGTLPATQTTKDAKPDMVGSDPKDEGGSTASGSGDGSHTMGDQGKLPATGAASSRVSE